MKIHQGVSSVSVQILSKDSSAQIGFWNNFEQRLYTAPPARPMSPSSKSTRWSKAKDVTNVFQRWLSMVSGQSKQSCQGIVSSVVYVYEIIGPDNPTCSQFPPDTEFRLNAKKDKGKGEDAVKERVGKGI